MTISSASLSKSTDFVHQRSNHLSSDPYYQNTLTSQFLVSLSLTRILLTKVGMRAHTHTKKIHFPKALS